MTLRTLALGRKTIRVDADTPRIARRGLRSLAILEPIAGARELDVSNNDLRSLRDMPRMPNLRTLHLTGNRLADVEGIARVAPALHTLYAGHIADPSGLARLRHLRVLMLATGERDLRFLQRSSVGYLAIDAPLRSLNGLERLTNLGELVVHGAKLARLTEISHRKLWKLIMPDCGLRSIPRLTTPALQILFLYDNPITEMGDLGKAPKVGDLQLENTKIRTLEGLERLHNLHHLNIPGRTITRITATTDRNLRGLSDLALRTGSTRSYAVFAARRTII
jgi:Leucine-rich repeat (LRR) protein